MFAPKNIWLIQLLILMMAVCHHEASSQNNQYLLTNNHLTNTNHQMHQHGWESINFKNIGLVDFYYNEKEVKQIRKEEKNKNLDKLQLLLVDYVSKFGTANFSHNSDMLWRLGQLYEKTGNMEMAKYLYRIVLKHTDYNIEYIWQYYDNMTANDQDDYVPIDYYYELVEYRKQIDTLRPPRGVFINMGENVNSHYEDYGPSLSIQNDKLLFASKRNRLKHMGNEVVNEDIFWADREGDSWGEAQPFEGINTYYNEGSPCLSKDGSTLYFVRCESNDGFGNCDIYSANLQSDGTWGNVKNLGINVNSDSWDSHPSLSHSEDTLYFASDRAGGFGSTDIYYTYKEKGKWMPAKNMGPVINTKGTDVSPFYHPIHHVLYFSSNGQLLNFGNFDIYKSYFVDGHWFEPKNIGPLVNGQGEEFYFTIDSESRYLFYARSEFGKFQNLDLFSFPLPMGAQPTATTIFSGVLRDSISGLPFKGIVSIIDLENGIEVAPKYIREDGSFSFELINNNQYLLVIQGEDFFRIEKIFNLDGDTSMNFSTPPVSFVRMKFESLEFATNSSEIHGDMFTDLDKILDFMLDNPQMELQISGHTDSQGDKQANFTLSQKRADAIKHYLVSKGGIDPLRIEATGYGDTQPIVKEEITEEHRKLNRRVEFKIIRPDEKKADWGLND